MYISRLMQIGFALGSAALIAGCATSSTMTSPTKTEPAAPARAAASVPGKRANPIRSMVGKYEVTSCSIDDAKGTNRAYISTVKPEFRNGKPELAIQFYHSSKDATGDFSLPLGKGVRKTMGADGNESWTTQLTDNSIVHNFIFDRKGSTSWPDLHYEISTKLTRDPASRTLMIESTRNGKPTQTCTLRSLAGNSGESTIAKARRLKNASLEEFAKAASSSWAEGVDFDQAAMQISRLRFVTAGEAKREQLEEMLRLQVLGMRVSKLKLKSIDTNGDMAKLSKDALNTILSLGEDAEDPADFKPVRDFATSLETFLKTHGAKFKIHFVNWSESDADGEGLLFIDSANGQAFYLGSGYFS